MASKSRGGLSKREYAAKQAGGNLNYKTGKISTPKKSSSKSSSSNPYAKYQSMDWGSAAEAAKRAGIDTSTGSGFDIAMNEKYNPNNAGRLRASKINELRNYDWATAAQKAKEYGLDTSTGSDFDIEMNLKYNPENSTGLIKQKEQRVGENYRAGKYGTPSQVSKPTSQRTLASIALNPEGASELDSPQSFPDISAGQTTDKTQRRFPGNGLLSKGTYGNGSGDYGIEGAFSTNKLSEEDNLLNTLLGIPTAKAAEMQTNLFNQPNTDSLGRPYTGYSAQNGGMSTRYGVDTPPTFTPKNTLNEDYESGATGGYKPQATGGSGSGGVAQQYAQQGENPQEKYYKEAIKNQEKDYKEAIKNQKAIRDETLKSLKKQLEATLEALNSEYDESQESGTNALNKQKVEDLNALNARFSFGLNQDPNSEQSIQYAQRTSNDYAGQLADFLQKLSTSRMKDVNSARSTYDQNKSSAIQNYYSQKSSAQEKLAQLMASLKEARINNAKKLSSDGTTAESKKQAAIMKLLNQAANMPSGGREYAQQIANIQGLGDISGYTPNGWENAYNPNFGKQAPSNIVSIGNGYVLDKDTGDVYQAY